MTSEMSGLAIDIDRLKSVFSFRVEGIRLVVPSYNVVGVIAFEPPTRVPRTPSHILGLLPYGDGALAVVDLANFLEIPKQQAQADIAAVHRVIVTRDRDLEAGFLCNQTHGVMPFDNAQLETSTVLKSGRLAEFVSWELDDAQSRVGLLNLASVLENARVGSTRGER